MSMCDDSPLNSPMKINSSFVAALLISFPAMSGAFTLDALGYSGSDLTSNPVSVTVPGYGELVFESVAGTTLVVNSAYENDNGFGGPSLSFDQNDSVKITFTGAQPLNVDFDFVGVSAGENFVVEKDLITPQAFILTLQGSGDGAGLYAISWNTDAVPEPASALLGLMGAAVFAFRRRR